MIISKPNKGTAILKTLGLFVVVGLIGIALAAWKIQSIVHKQYSRNIEEPILFEISSNESASAIIKHLENEKLIHHPRIFKRYLQYTGSDKKFKKGIYEIPSSYSYHSLIDLFSSGKTATRTVTIPEGRVSWEIYDILNSFYAWDSLEFDNLVHDANFAKKLGLQSKSLEGYIFPSTYHLPFKLSPEEFLKIAVGQFKATISNIDFSNSYIYKKHGLHGLITMASIVEEEAAVVSEQKEIAGVFTNRLKQGWTLGADPTVRFAIKKLSGPLYRSELNNNSPYNTRKFVGLPPGPISNPGEMAIRAAANPNDTPNMFFVAKDDGSREHFFSTHESKHNYYKTVRKKNQDKN